jgi:hypothetical protein
VFQRRSIDFSLCRLVTVQVTASAQTKVYATSLEPRPDSYSHLNATIGSTFIARRAGI